MPRRYVDVEDTGDELVIRVKKRPLQRSASGKTIIVASESGISDVQIAVDGGIQRLYVGINAYVYPPDGKAVEGVI